MSVFPEELPGRERFGPQAAERLTAYAREVLRWNRAVNLVSRAKAGEHVARLLDLCISGFYVLDTIVAEAWTRWAEASGTVAYADIGSGAGLPGIPWRILVEERTPAPPVGWLVEPRTRRAWFLARQIQILGLRNCRVQGGRWGDVRLEEENYAQPRPWVVSLMMLAMGDPEVIAGWNSALPRTAAARPGLTIVRLRGSLDKGETESGIARALSLPGPARRRVVPFESSRGGGTLIVSFHA